MKTWALAILILVAATSSWATTYYVNNCVSRSGENIGNDSNNGVSISTPWLTLARVNAQTFHPGDFVRLEKTCTWRESLTVPSSGTSSNPVTFGAYGTGASPIITGANNITGFSMVTSNVWDASVATRPYVVAVGVHPPKAMTASKAAIAAPGDWYWATGILSVYSTSDPSGTVEAGARDNPINLNNHSYITLDGLDVKNGNLPFGTAHGVVKVGFANVTGIVIRNSIIEGGSANGIDIHGTTTHDFTITNSVIKNNGGWGIFVNNPGYAFGTISNSTVAGNGWASVTYGQQFAGIEGYLGNISIYGNTVYANGPVCSGAFQCHGIYGLEDTNVANIYNNAVYGNPTGAGIKIIGSANIYHNLIYGNYVFGIGPGQNRLGSSVVYNIWDNVIHDNNTSNRGGGIVEQSMVGPISLNIYNNTLYNNANTSDIELKVDDNVTVLNIENNILYASPAHSTITLSVPQAGVGTINHNIYWRADGNPDIYYNGTQITWAAWQALGYDANGINANPLLSNPSAGNLWLQSGSPAINVGVNLGTTYDWGLDPFSVWPTAVVLDSQNNYGFGWDIGAYVYQPR
jgi:hypothetical protein